MCRHWVTKCQAGIRTAQIYLLNKPHTRVFFASLQRERRALQIAVSIACLIPVSAGLQGILYGSGAGLDTNGFDSHYRYLSGLLLAIGGYFLALVPHIETKRSTMRLLTGIVVTGGVARLLGFIVHGIPNTVMCMALVMELIVTPLLCKWQHRVARTHGY